MIPFRNARCPMKLEPIETVYSYGKVELKGMLDTKSMMTTLSADIVSRLREAGVLPGEFKSNDGFWCAVGQPDVPGQKDSRQSGEMER